MKSIRSQRGFSAIEVVLVLAVIAILGLAGWYVYHTQRNVTTEATATKPASQTTSGASTPRYISYGDVRNSTGGIAIMTASDVDKLTGISSKLKSYLLNHLAITCTEGGVMPCDRAGETYAQYTVISTYGNFAVTQAVDHFAVLGPNTSGNIAEIFSGQGGSTCSDLQRTIAKYHIPSAMYSQGGVFSCYKTAGSTSAVSYSEYISE